MLEIKYRKIFPIFMLAGCAVIFWSAFVSGFKLSTVMGLILLPVSILMLTKNIIIIKTDCIEMKNLLGMTLKKYPYKSEQVSIRNNNLYIDNQKVFSTIWAGISSKQLKAFFISQQ
ncbi:hypothetical protein [Calothrix sp. NIES-3974]|uniref:hypothetical protein n=1 Tax=Calothrix sp. NIES-3974 TaxID=2005462 RepID=UPI000B5EB857|nr:hypothetical protein [Calothrix sp. NIES-3974]BAZ03478.1 hypothetical protein NIES3974_01040 [Calothrix sp. NIES-3974]